MRLLTIILLAAILIGCGSGVYEYQTITVTTKECGAVLSKLESNGWEVVSQTQCKVTRLVEGYSLLSETQDGLKITLRKEK